MRRDIISSQLQDQQHPNIRELQAQLRQCEASANQFISSSKNFKSLTLQKSRKKKVPQSLDHYCTQNSSFSNTDGPLSSCQNYETSNQDSANGLIMVESPSNISQICLQNIKRPSMLRRRKKKYNELKDVIMNQKVNGLKETFCNKIKRNNPFSIPVDYNTQGNAFEKSFLNSNGFELKQTEEKIMSILCIYNVVSSIFIFTISIVFPQISQVLIMRIIEILGAFIFFLQMVFNFITVRSSLGRKLQTIREISSGYFKDNFRIDCINLFMILIYLMTQSKIIDPFRMVVLLKLPDCMDKMEKLEVYFVENYYNEQYWSLIKVFLFNFCFAHMLAILLVGMSSVNPSNNWLANKNLLDAPWYEKYIWSYYWSTTIMLTIGFGDITPACYQEALCMIFIETVSCIVLAYNINCVGSLISNIRSQDIVKSKNMKIFKKLADKNEISESLCWRINNYLEEHTNINKLFNIQQEAQFIQRLPSSFRTDYLKQANKAIFQKVFFFNLLMEKTLLSLAEKIQMKIAHPNESIFNIETNLDVFILKNGEIGFISKKGNRKYIKNIFDQKKVQQNDAPFLLNSNFITKNLSNYQIKSLLYSVLYCLKYDNLIEIFKETHQDYQMYCKQRDKNKHKLDEFQVFPCEFCPNQKHTKFSCPKLHFIPLHQHVTNRYLFKEKKGKNVREASFDRVQLPKQSALSNFIYNKDVYKQKKNASAISNMNNFKKSKDFVLQQFKTFQNEDLQNESYHNQTKMINIEAITKLQYNFLQNTTETIRNQINKALGVEKAEDDVWLLDLDRMKNYKNYFTQNNPCNLLVAFDLDVRIKRQTQSNVYKQISSIFDQISSNIGFESLISQQQVDPDVERSVNGYAAE